MKSSRSRFPRQINFQVTAEMAREIDRGTRSPRGASRAQIIRECIEEALDTVLLRRGIRPRRKDHEEN